MFSNTDTLRKKNYKSWRLTIPGNAGWGAVGTWIDIGDALKVKYGTDYDKPAQTLLIIASDDFQFRLNGLTEDIVVVPIADAGKVLCFLLEDLEIYKIYFASQIPSGSATDVDITLLVTG